MIFVDDKQPKHDESTKSHATNIRITSTTRHQKRFSTSNTKVKARTNRHSGGDQERGPWITVKGLVATFTMNRSLSLEEKHKN